MDKINLINLILFLTAIPVLGLLYKGFITHCPPAQKGIAGTDCAKSKALYSFQMGILLIFLFILIGAYFYFNSK